MEKTLIKISNRFMIFYFEVSDEMLALSRPFKMVDRPFIVQKLALSQRIIFVSSQDKQPDRYLSSSHTMSVEVSHLDVERDQAFEKHIESITTYKFRDCNTVRFIPEGRVEVLFQIGSRFLHRTPSDRSWVKRPSGFVGGLHDHAYHVKPLDGKSSCIGIKFKPGSARHFMGCSQSELRNKVIALEEIWGTSAKEITLAANISNAHEVAAKIHPFLKAHFANPSDSDQNFIANSITGTLNRERVKELAKRLGLSTSHFRKKFIDHVGLSPSQYAKILTIAQAIQRLQSNDYESLTELALELGYYDQAHFIRAFRSVTGTSPGMFRLEAP